MSVEARPFTRADLATALAPFVDLAPLARALCTLWPPPLAGYHRMHFDGGNVILTLLQGDALGALAQLDARADALFLDGFPSMRDPEIWSPEAVRVVARLAAPGATLATGTVAGGVKTALCDAGFRIERRPGVDGTGEMLYGVSECTAAAVEPSRRAIVVGAGLAGTLVAERLASRDWAVDLVDARDTRAAPAVGLVRPLANLRDATNAQLSRSAFTYALQHYRALQYDGYHLQWDRCGVLQLAGDEDEAARFAAIAGGQGHPPEVLEYVDPARAAQLCGREVDAPGWWFASGAWVALESLAVASLGRAGSLVRQARGRAVQRLEREGNDWHALDDDGRVIAEAPVVVVANAADATRLVPEARLRLSAVRGQVTYLPPDPSRVLEVAVSGTGYVAPMPGGGHCIGATFQHDDPDPAVRAADHASNLAGLAAMLPGFGHGLEPARLEGWTGWRTTVPDRLPIFGATAIPGVYIATGLGSRGLLWAPLGAELLACQLEGEPLPLPAALVGVVSPKRFLS